MIGRDATEAHHVSLVNAKRVCKRRSLASQQRPARALHALSKVVAVAIHVLVDRALNQLGLLHTRHQRGIADLLLGRLMNLDR
jgi:hypothetical protein